MEGQNVLHGLDFQENLIPDDDVRAIAALEGAAPPP